MERRPDPAPLEGDVVRVVTVGTVVWAVLALCLLPFWSRLEDAGHLWWVGACASGAALGLLGVRFCRRRESRLRSPEL